MLKIAIHQLDWANAANQMLRKKLLPRLNGRKAKRRKLKIGGSRLHLWGISLIPQAELFLRAFQVSRALQRTSMLSKIVLPSMLDKFFFTKKEKTQSFPLSTRLLLRTSVLPKQIHFPCSLGAPTRLCIGAIFWIRTIWCRFWLRGCLNTGIFH